MNTGSGRRRGTRVRVTLDQKKALSVIFYIKQALDGLLPLPHNTLTVGIGVISIGNGSTKQWNN